MMDKHETREERDHALPRTTTTGDDEQDYRGPGDSSVQLSARDDPHRADPTPPATVRTTISFPTWRRTGDEEQEELGDIERPASNPTDRPYGER